MDKLFEEMPEFDKEFQVQETDVSSISVSFEIQQILYNLTATFQRIFEIGICFVPRSNRSSDMKLP